MQNIDSWKKFWKKNIFGFFQKYSCYLLNNPQKYLVDFTLYTMGDNCWFLQWETSTSH